MTISPPDAPRASNENPDVCQRGAPASRVNHHAQRRAHTWYMPSLEARSLMTDTGVAAGSIVTALFWPSSSYGTTQARWTQHTSCMTPTLILITSGVPRRTAVCSIEPGGVVR